MPAPDGRIVRHGVTKRNRKEPKGEEEPNRVSHSKLITKCLWGVFCLTGLMYQSILVTIDYTKYPVTSQVTIKITKDIEPVAFSYCFPVSSLRINQKLPVNSICRGRINYLENLAVYHMCSSELLFNYTTQVLLNNYTSSLDQTITSMKILERDGEVISSKWVPLNQSLQHMKYESFLKAQSKCLRVQHKFIGPIRFDSLTKLISQKYMYVLSGTYDSLNDEDPYLNAYVHDSNTYPHGIDHTMFPEVINRGNEEKQVSFQKISSHYLPPPFHTKCTDDYASRGLESRAHCIESCMEERVHQDFNCTYFGKTIVHMTDKTRICNFKGDDYQKLMSHSKECQELCPLSCYTNNYLPILASSYAASPKTYVIFIKIDYPTISVELSAKLTLLEYLIYITSCSGLWFGFCFYSFFKSIHIYINHYRQQKVCPQINIQQNVQHNITVHPSPPAAN